MLMTIGVRPTTDLDAVRKIQVNPDVYDKLADDGFPPSWAYKPFEHEGVIYLLCEENDEAVGVITFTAESSSVVDSHIAFLPNRSGNAVEFARQSADWIFENTDYIKIVGKTPFCNRHAHIFALRVGFKDEGINRESYVKDGEVYDMWYTGITKGEWE